MHILIFSTDDHLYPAGGAENAMGEITKRIPDATFDLVCARLRKTASYTETVGNVRIIRVGVGIPRIDGIVLALFGHIIALRLHAQKPYDAVWSIMASYGAFAAVRVQRRTRIPFLLTLQEGDPIPDILHRVRFVRAQFNAIFKTADAVQAISHYLKRWAESMGARQVRVVPNGVDVQAFTAPLATPLHTETRASFGFQKDAFILITSSRLEKKNGVGDIIEALPLLPPTVVLVICGSGSLQQTLMRRVEELGIQTRVRFMGMVPMALLPQYLHASDAFIRPSLSEGLGNAFLEAMAARLPTIGTPVGGIPDFLEEGKTGFLCEPSNPHSVAEAVLRTQSLSNADRLRILDTASEVVRTRYDWDDIAREMHTMFTSLLHARTRS
jgi:glycosyltransferase involved in cell wall biosynthesis